MSLSQPRFHICPCCTVNTDCLKDRLCFDFEPVRFQQFCKLFWATSGYCKSHLSQQPHTWTPNLWKEFLQSTSLTALDHRKICHIIQNSYWLYHLWFYPWGCSSNGYFSLIEMSERVKIKKFHNHVCCYWLQISFYYLERSFIKVTNM